MFTKRLALALTLTALTACGGKPASPTPGSVATPMPAVTITLATSTPVVAIPTSAPADTPEPSPTSGCTNDLKYLQDVTVPDGQSFTPGQTINKKWSVQNTGTCDWGPAYRLVLTGGDSMSAPSELALYPAKAGVTTTLEVVMKAPANPGSYTGRWQARDPNGNLFGWVVFIRIEVVPPPQ